MSREAPGVGGNSFKRAIVGLDIARFGDDASVIATRIGRDAASIPFKEVRKLDGPMVGQALAAHCGYLLDTLKFREVRIYLTGQALGHQCGIGCGTNTTILVSGTTPWTSAPRRGSRMSMRTNASRCGGA